MFEYSIGLPLKFLLFISILNPIFVLSYSIGVYFNTVYIGLAALFTRTYKLKKAVALSSSVLLTYLICIIIANDIQSIDREIYFLTVLIFPIFYTFVPITEKYIHFGAFRLSVTISIIVLFCLLSLGYYILVDTSSDELYLYFGSASIYGGIAAALALTISVQVRNYLSPEMLLLVCLIFLLLLSGHRAGMLAFLCALAAYTIRANLVKAIAIVLPAISGFGLIIVYTYIELFFFQGEVSVDTINTSGRLVTWIAIIESMGNFDLQLLFGRGIGATQEYLNLYHDGIKKQISLPHNEFLRISYDIGIVGLIIWIYFICTIFYFYVNNYISFLTLYFIEVTFSNVLYWHVGFLLIIMLLNRK